MDRGEFFVSRPRSLAEALQAMAIPGVRPLAGGTDLIPQWREGRRELSGMVDLKQVPELQTVSFQPATGARIGAAAPLSELYALPWLAIHYGALDDAARLIGGWQIQNRATLGGNLCNGSPSADSAPPLIALEAVAELVSPHGSRNVPLEDFFTGPGKTVVNPHELLLAVNLPAPHPHAASAFLRFIPRAEMDIAVASVAAHVQLDAAREKILVATIALGAVAPTPVRAIEAEAVLIGQIPSEKLLAAAGAQAMLAAQPIDDVRGTAAYREHLVEVLTVRVLKLALERARRAA
jgi:carbon-monoxide dehydrogenase medium subunit